MQVESQVRSILRDTLSLGARANRLVGESPLLGAVPELDSMAVVTVIGALEDAFGITVQDDEISGATFGTFGSLVAYVQAKVDG